MLSDLKVLYSGSLYTDRLVATMPNIDPSWVQVTPVVYEFLVIELKESLIESHLVQYQITDSSGNIIRKGSFSGMVIQLRLNFLKDGSYTITLGFENYDPMSYSFEKKSKNDSDDMIITMY
ncbi:MAG: hypothetical protein JJE22_14345 [Bacteroidia bacterium]|nr:hypothetical protein [Bacteroidia bacterium]